MPGHEIDTPVKSRYPFPYDGKEFFRQSLMPKKIDRLTTLDLPQLYQEQLDLITPETIMARDVEAFDPKEAIAKIAEHNGKHLLAIDFGGDKAIAIPYVVQKGILVADEYHIQIEQKINNGENYLLFFERLAKEAKQKRRGVAISFGGPLDGTKPMSIPNATALFDGMQRKYGGDFANLFPTLLVANNDAQAGIKKAAIEVQKRLIQAGMLDLNASIMLPIDGGGDGLAALINGRIVAMEVGHVRLIDALNPYHQKTPCSVLGRTFVCMERGAASGAGIEPIWQQQRGIKLSGKEISEIYYQNGDLLARNLYDNAAAIYAHGLIGAANIEGLMNTPTDTAIVYHGGGFRVIGLMDRITQIIAHQRGFTPQTLYTDKLCTHGSNACAEGAAIAALCV